MNAGRGLPRVDVLVTVPAGSRLDEVACGAGPGLAACLTRHRVEWRATGPDADGRTTWRFRAPDAESVRIALRHAGVPFDTVTVTGDIDSTMRS